MAQAKKAKTKAKPRLPRPLHTPGPYISSHPLTRKLNSPEFCEAGFI
jgi:hypothetical protein